jgi:hypothetical protein
MEKEKTILAFHMKNRYLNYLGENYLSDIVPMGNLFWGYANYREFKQSLALLLDLRGDNLVWKNFITEIQQETYKYYDDRDEDNLTLNLSLLQGLVDAENEAHEDDFKWTRLECPTIDDLGGFGLCDNMGNLLITKEKFDSGVGTVNIDNDYNTYYTTYIEHLDDNERNLVIKECTNTTILSQLTDKYTEEELGIIYLVFGAKKLQEAMEWEDLKVVKITKEEFEEYDADENDEPCGQMYNSYYKLTN